MRAIVYESYGRPETLEVASVAKPVVDDDTVLVRVHAASVNPLDWHNLTGEPYLMRLQSGVRRPASPTVLGVDFAGCVEAVGKNVTRVQPGDEVFGASSATFAEFAVVSEAELAHKPKNLSFAEAAALPVAGLTALQGLRDHAALTSGQTVLINGASGGVGTLAVQIAKALGAEVTGVCSTTKIEATRSLGADHIVDYTKEDFAKSGRQYDVMFDGVGSRALSQCRRVLDKRGVYVLISGPKHRWFGPLGRFLKTFLAFAFASQTAKTFFAEILQNDLEELARLAETAAIVPVIDRRFPLREAGRALAYLEQGHASGKIVLEVADGA